MGQLMMFAGIAAIAAGIWLLVRRSARGRSTVPLGLLLLVAGALVVLSAYWSGAVIGGDSTAPPATPVLSPIP